MTTSHRSTSHRRAAIVASSMIPSTFRARNAARVNDDAATAAAASFVHQNDKVSSQSKQQKQSVVTFRQWMKPCIEMLVPLQGDDSDAQEKVCRIAAVEEAKRLRHSYLRRRALRMVQSSQKLELSRRLTFIIRHSSSAEISPLRAVNLLSHFKRSKTARITRDHTTAATRTTACSEAATSP